ncbi:MAG: hypothetical protein IKQ99_02655 [Alphaproteobacteria bacterium]|nr:hypothetical protein [Alphaproteobacteria bacterium]
MTNSSLSLLQGTTWYWRQGLRQAPIHSNRGRGDVCKTRELYMPVKSEEYAQSVIEELKSNNIKANFKRTHSTFDVVPAGSLIVFAATSLYVGDSEEEKNVQSLKKYISEHGGTIVEGAPQRSTLRSIFSFFCGGRK